MEKIKCENKGCLLITVSTLQQFYYSKKEGTECSLGSVFGLLFVISRRDKCNRGFNVVKLLLLCSVKLHFP